MEHRQFGYAFFCVSAIGAIAIVGSNCGTPFSACGDGTCVTTSGQAGVGGTTSSTGGTGGGGSSVGGSPTGGSAGAGGTGGSIPTGGAGGAGGQGGGLPPVLCGPDQIEIPTSGVVVCWFLGSNHHPPGTTLGLGGIVKEPGSPDVAQPLFAGCETSNPSQNTLVCPFGDLAVGTDFVFDPYATDGVTTFIRCDVPGLPTSQCFGEYWVYVDGAEVSYFIHPPTGRWTYDASGSRLRLVYTDPG